MVGRQILNHFKMLFPEYEKKIVKYVDHANNSITIFLDDGRKFEFRLGDKIFTLEGRR